MEIQPATLAQVQRAADGRMVEIPDDVANVAKDLQTIDPSLRLRWSEVSGHYAVYQHFEHPNGVIEDHLVLTAQECDQRIVKRVERIAHSSYDFEAELAKGAKGREDRSEFRESLGDYGERLEHALRRDLGVRDRIAL